MGALLLLVNAVAITLPVPMPVIIVVFVILAVVLAVGSFLLFRSGGRKKGAKATTSGGNSDWQRQAQQGGAGAWNQQGGQASGGWGQPAQQQQPGGWGAQPQQQPGGWGAQAPSQPANPWGAPANQSTPAQAQQQPAWGMPNAAPANPWGTPAAQQQQPAANQWGNQGAQAPWEPAPTPAPSAQDPWGQQSANPWGTPASQPLQPQQGQPPQTAYGAGNNSAPSWGQSFGSSQPDPWSNAPAAQQQPANQWGSPAAAPVPASGSPGVPPWGPQGGFGQNNAAGPGMMQQDANTLFANSEADKTILRSTGPQGALGVVRVEEGKEPGRIYEVRKESLSIGRSRESDIFLEDLAVSRLHASIVNMGNGNYALKDEGSANGTKVNGQLVNKYQTYPLQEGDRIQLGQTVLVFGRH